MLRQILISSSITMLAAGSVHAAELEYKWKKGDTHRFEFEADNQVEMKLGGAMGGMMGGMMGGGGAGGGIGAKIKTRSTFSQKVVKVLANGTAEIDFVVEKLDMFQGGKKIGSITEVPPQARKVRAEIDKKGKAKFYKMVTVYMKDDQVYVGVKQEGKYGASGKARMGDQSIEIVASVDPKTGRVEAKMEVKKHKPKLKKVKVKKEDPGVDILPKDILHMMQLPDGPVPTSGSHQIKMPIATVNLSVNSWKNNVLDYRTKIGMDAKMQAPADDEGGQGGGMPGMGGGMPGMGGGMPGMGGGGGSGGKSGASMSTKMKGTVDVQFDVGKGRLLSMKGDMTNTTSLGGMGSMKTATQFTLTRK